MKMIFFVSVLQISLLIFRYISISIKKLSSFVLSPVNGIGVFIFISLKDGMGAGS